MANPDKLIELLSKEKKALQTQKERKINLDKQIKNTESRIEKYENTLNRIRINEVEELFKEKGTSLDDVANAVKQGDMSNVVNQIEISDIINGKKDISELAANKVEINAGEHA